MRNFREWPQRDSNWYSDLREVRWFLFLPEYREHMPASFAVRVANIPSRLTAACATVCLLLQSCSDAGSGGTTSVSAAPAAAATGAAAASATGTDW
jgi:hypothetical protein